jgi:Flp pilus assembly pilin Flp
VTFSTSFFGKNPAINFLNNKWGGIMKNILRNQKGQGVMEYVIISSLVGIVCIATVKGFGQVVQERIKNMKSSIVKNIDLKD